MNDSPLTFLAEAVTPWHAVEALARSLSDAGFSEVHESGQWRLEPGKGYFFRRGGSVLAALVVGSQPEAGWNIAAAHTDSPGWRLKLATQKPQASGVVRIGTEVYGLPIYSTWFDRPLAIAGQVVLKAPQGPRPLLVKTPALGVIPNLAVHYNREVNKVQAYDLSENVCLLAALGGQPNVEAFLSHQYGFNPADWMAADLYAVDAQAPDVLGPDGLFLAPRIDNLTGCLAVVEGLLATSAPSQRTKLVVCFDQEEVGSSTWTGADSSFLGDLMARVHHLVGGSLEEFSRAKASSFVLSVDSAHGVHPNWGGHHDEGYAPLLGKGPVLKSSARFSYATTANSEARVRTLAELAGVPLQAFRMKSTLTPGSTIGPITTSWTGIPGADVGIPIWAMHSIRETGDLRDQHAMVRLVAALLGDTRTW